uniref:NADH:ubiquinone reductase (H(+)-translocating) n=1 Tax=Rhinebothrium megacanthophallus TaxID=595946 RepID=A0A8K1W617_9CEST|nr:NADH dehydrogenase subunit 5 [Rhinebothrium megacanthophallus]
MLFFGFILLMLLACGYMIIGSDLILSFNTLLLSGGHWEPIAHIDIVTMLIFLMLTVCYGYAFYYTSHYFGGSVDGLQLSKLIFLFVSVMASLIFTGDYLSTLMFWEYLGVVSFFLILFYSNYLSLRSSVVTLVSSRFGDVCLFLIIALSLYNTELHPVVLLICFFLVIMTKSAGFPFISWLLEAMRAPTPVSSLVHSSTLVAAGVWFAMRYNMFVYFNDSGLFLIVLLLTILITGSCCFFFLDLKKIVALSTCNNISWCIVYLLCGDIILSLFQLVSHGVSKCLLFMLVGDVMSGSGGSQASNCVYSPRLYGNWGMFGLFSVILGLSGAPFIGVFFTKHFLLSTFSSGVNIVFYALLLFCVFLSYFYSFRLCSVLSNINLSGVSGVLFAFDSGLMVFFWLVINYFIATTMDEYSAVGGIASFTLIIFQIVSCLTAYYLFSSTLLSSWSSCLFGCDNLVEKLYNDYMLLKNWSSLNYFRWDHYVLSTLNGFGSYGVRLYNVYLLNILMISIIFTLMCCFILYNH